MVNHSNKLLRIFLIGFNRCGTTSFHQFFQANQISSVHWYGNELARCLQRNIKYPGFAPLFRIDRWTAYSDLIALPGTPWDASLPYQGPLIEANRFYPQLHRAYPRSLFILNTRDPDAWVASRFRHDQGRFAEAYRRALAPDRPLTDAALRERWLQQWRSHHQSVHNFFRAKPQARFLEFHLNRDDPAPLMEALSSSNGPLSQPHFPHLHRSP